MTDIEIAAFVNIVTEMREAQKQYFKQRMSFDLEKSKRLEKEVDKYIKHYCDVDKGIQKTLF